MGELLYRNGFFIDFLGFLPLESLAGREIISIKPLKDTRRGDSGLGPVLNLAWYLQNLQEGGL